MKPTSSPANGKSAGWRPNGVPFCWQPKEALRRIGEHVDSGNVTTALAVYVALTRIASDTVSATFERPMGYITRLAGVSRKTVERRLADLVRLNLVTVEPQRIPGTKAQAFSRYTLTPISRKVASPSPKVASGNDPRAVAVREEDKKPRKGDWDCS